MMRKCKILFIGSFLSKTRGTIGISEKLAKNLQSEGIDIKIASTQEYKWQRIVDIIYNCLMFSGNVIHIDVFSGRAYIIAEIAVIISKFRGKKIILTLHGGKLPEFYQQNPTRIEKIFIKANLILTPSLYLQIFFRDRGYNVIYLPNSIDLSRFPYVDTLGYAPKLLWVRAFTSIYHPELAVETLYQVREHFSEASLTMIGPDKGLLPSIQSLIIKLNLSKAVNIVGPVSNEKLYQHYHGHRVFLNTTAYESFGVAVMEAAACGIPIVSTPAGEIPLLWKDEEEILITKDWSPESMAESVIRILEEQELSTALSENARKKAEQFDWMNIKNKWLELLEDD